MLMAAISSETTMPLGYWLGSCSQRTVKPVLVVVAEISSTITRQLIRGRARQFWLMKGEEPVLDFVPLAGAGGQVADHDVEAEFVGQFLQFTFPQPHSRAVAAAPIGGDQQPGRVGVTRAPEVEPPPADAVDREGGRVMVDADAHPAGICGE